MTQRLEDLVRRSLEVRADDVQPDPRIWTRVQRRIRRARAVRLSLSGATAAAAVAAVAVLAPEGTPELELAPGTQPSETPVDEPSAEPSASPAKTPGAQPSATSPPQPEPEGPQQPPDELVPQEGLPAPVALKRRQIHRAARDRDWQALRAAMTEEFSYSFGFDPDRDEAIAYWRRHPEVLGRIVALLEQPYGKHELEHGETWYFWPRLQVRSPDEWTSEDIEIAHRLGYTDEQIEQWRGYGGYLGARLGIDAAGSWTSMVTGGD